jgi:hypothetical protein
MKSVMTTRDLELSLQPGATVPCNLSYRNLAEISGLTRVTVTKAISHFRQVGALVREGEVDWLLPEAAMGPAPTNRNPPRQTGPWFPIGKKLLVWVEQQITSPYQAHCQSWQDPPPNPVKSPLKFANS